MQQQQLMQPAMAGAFNTTHITTDHIQQYLDENKSLILKILENQNSGKLGECAENQARLQRNLMYLAAIADCQPQPSSIYTQPAMNYMQHQQSQPMASQSVMAVRSPVMYAHQQPYSALQQQQAFNGQLTLQSETNMGVGGTGAFPDFGRSTAGEGSRAAGSSRNEANGSAASAGGQGNNSRRGKGDTL